MSFIGPLCWIFIWSIRPGLFLLQTKAFFFFFLMCEFILHFEWEIKTNHSTNNDHKVVKENSLFLCPKWVPRVYEFFFLLSHISSKSFRFTQCAEHAWYHRLWYCLYFSFNLERIPAIVAFNSTNFNRSFYHMWQCLYIYI